jgi:hypothetical protein
MSVAASQDLGTGLLSIIVCRPSVRPPLSGKRGPVYGAIAATADRMTLLMKGARNCHTKVKISQSNGRLTLRHDVAFRQKFTLLADLACDALSIPGQAVTIDISSVANSTNTSQIWSGASARMPASQKMSGLFDQIDSSGSGTISQAQFNQAFQTLNPPNDFKAAGATAVWSQLDPNNTGSVSKQDFISGMTAIMRQLRADHGGSGSSPLSSIPSPSQTISTSAATLQNTIASGQRLDVTA